MPTTLKIKFVFVVFFELLAVISFVLSEQTLIKSFLSNVQWDKRKFYMAQIFPPAKYKLIIWDKLANATLLSSAIFDHRQSKTTQKQFVFAYDQKNFADYGKYFIHFVSVETNEQGQFLMRKNGRFVKWSSPLAKRFFNFTITPMRGSDVIPPDGSGMFTWQKVYVRKVTDAVDSVCHRIFDGNNRCVVNFFEKNFEWKRFIRLTLNTFWLAVSQFYGILPDWNIHTKINFFLVSTFRYLINDAKRCKELGIQMGEADAKLLGIYWDALAAAHKNGILSQRIRMADEQMAALIDQFCQIDHTFLLAHISLADQTKRENDFESFCSNWEKLQNDLALFTQNDAVMRAFEVWLFNSVPGLPISDQIRQIVQFWVKMFSVWLTKERETEEDERSGSTQRFTSPWLPFDLCLFRQIGELFTKGATEGIFTTKKVAQIEGIRETMGKICVEAIGAQYDFLRGNGPQSISTLNRWRTFCAKSQFFAVRKNGSESEPPGATDTDKNRCVICLQNELQIAFNPCRHLCACEDCAKKVEQNEKPRCPVCRSSVKETLRIYIPY